MPYYTNGVNEIFLPAGEPAPAGYEPGRLGDGGSDDDKAPTTREFPDGSLRQWNGESWDVIAKPPPAQQQRDRNLGNGVFETPNGEYYVLEPGLFETDGNTRRIITAAEAKRLVDPEQSGGMTAYQGAQLELDRQQEKRLAAEAQAQLELDRQQEKRLAAEAQARAEREAAQLAEQIRANKVQEAYLRDKLELDEKFGTQAETRATTDLLFRVQSEQAQLGEAYQSRVAQIQMFNAQQQFAVEQENQRRIEANQAARRQNAATIADFSTEAGDRGKLASFLLANSGNVGALNEAIAGGEDFRGGEGLAALGELYNEQAVLERGPSLASFNPVALPEAPKLDTSFLNGLLASLGMGGRETGTSGGLVDTANLTAQQALDAGLNPRGREGFEDRPATGDEQARFLGARGAPQFVLDALRGGGSTPQMERGGMAGGVAIAGDSSDGRENEEYVIPLGDDPVLIAPKRQGGILNSIMAMLNDPDAKFQDGGLFASTLFGGRTQSNMDIARGNLNAATSRALMGTPWEGLGRTPAPVEVSAPGTDPLAQRLAAGITATGTGVPRETFLNAILRMMPMALEMGRVSRRA